MADSVESPEKSGETKSVPLGDLITLKKASIERERKLKAQLDEAKQKIASLEADVKVMGANVEDDDDVKVVRDMLIRQKRELDALRAEHEKGVSSLTERERKLRAKELATQYSIDVSDLEDEEDIEGTALRLYADKLAEENKKLKETTGKSPAPIYETGSQGLIRRQPKDMSSQEFVDYEKSLKEKALSIK